LAHSIIDNQHYKYNENNKFNYSELAIADYYLISSIALSLIMSLPILLLLNPITR